MLFLCLLYLLLQNNYFVNFIYELFAKIYLFQTLSIFSENFEKEFDIPFIRKLKCFLNYRRNGVISILVKHYISK